ncbi:uncharacterized protein UDID_17338 [Ustilago sp. UG-2017a]|nr:uncharacterized protein UDID_17338 [Ustilago sp. UG-2017a]
MPPRIRDSDAESSDLSDGPHKERPPAAPHKQMLIVLKGMLIELTKRNKAKDADAYKKPSPRSDFHQRLSHTHDTLKEALKLTTKNWYSWNLSRTGPTVGNDDEGEIERRGRGDYQTSEGDNYERGHDRVMTQAKYVTPYHHCVITLKDTGIALDYEVLCTTLCKCQDSMITWTDHRASNVKMAQANLANGQVQNEEAYRHVVGQAMLNMNSHEVPLNNVLYVPDSNANLISVKALMNDGAHVIFDSECVTLEFSDGTMVTSNLNPHTRHYEILKPRHEALMVHPNDGLSELPKMFDDEAKAEKCTFTLNFMHKRCSHPGRNKSRIIKKLYKVKLPDCKCQDCIARKSTKAQMGKGHKLKTLCSDNGGKWVSAVATGWQNEAGFCWQKTLAYTSEQNGKAEHTIRIIQEMMITMMCNHCLPQTLWPFAAKAAVFTTNVLPNVNNWIPYHIFYGKDLQKPFTLLRTFGCLAWVNIPKAKCKELDEPAIPTIFVGYDEEHKGWKFLSPRHNPLIFWSNSACFLQDKSWCDCKDTTPIQGTNALHYKDTTNTTNLGYNDIDEHNGELQQPIDDIYQPLSAQDMTFEGDIVIPGPTDTAFEYPTNASDDASKPNLPPATSDQASNGSTTNGSRSTMPPGTLLLVTGIGIPFSESRAFGE